MLNYDSTSYYEKYNHIITNDFVNNIKNIYSDGTITNDDLLIIMLSGLSFNFIQYIFVCIFYEIYKQDENNSNTNLAKFLNTVDLSTHYIGGAPIEIIILNI